MENAEDPAAGKRRIAWLWLRRAVVGTAIWGAVLFVAAGRWDWLWGWAYLGVFLANQMVNALVLMPRDPALSAERTVMRSQGKAWDQVVVLFFVYGALAIVLVCALDLRLGWSLEMPVAAHIGGLVLMLLGSALADWAVATNPFFSAIVRIQTDRGHRVIRSGPYGWVRHPGYLGALMIDLVTPLILGSTWALVPAVVVVGIGVLRTALEDRTLYDELPGYAEYAASVRYRLLPLIW